MSPGLCMSLLPQSWEEHIVTPRFWVVSLAFNDWVIPPTQRPDFFFMWVQGIVTHAWRKTLCPLSYLPRSQIFEFQVSAFYFMNVDNGLCLKRYWEACWESKETMLLYCKFSKSEAEGARNRSTGFGQGWGYFLMWVDLQLVLQTLSLKVPPTYS